MLPKAAAIAIMFFMATTLLWASTRLALRISPYTLRDGQDIDGAPRTRKDWFKMAAAAVGVVAVASIFLKLLPYIDDLIGLKGYLAFTLVMLCIGIFRGEVGMSKPWRVVVSLCALALSTYWFIVPSWFSANLVAFGILFFIVYNIELRMSFMTASFMKMAIVLVALAFGYDFVQVFLSSSMEAAANLAIEDSVPMLITIPASLSLHAPMAAGLGVGDIVFPALLVIMAGRISQRTNCRQIYRSAILGYALGLLAADAAIVLFNTGQPATIYLFPMIIGSVWLSARKHGVSYQLKQRQYVVT